MGLNGDRAELLPSRVGEDVAMWPLLDRASGEPANPDKDADIGVRGTDLGELCVASPAGKGEVRSAVTVGDRVRTGEVVQFP